MQGWLVYLFYSWHCRVVLDFLFSFLPLAYPFQSFFTWGGDINWWSSKVWVTGHFDGFSSSLQQEIMWESCRSVRSCRGISPISLHPQRGVGRKFHVPDTSCSRKDFPGVPKDLKANRTPRKEKPEGVSTPWILWEPPSGLKEGAQGLRGVMKQMRCCS